MKLLAERKIILIGKTGDGKSSAGNTILRKEVFNPKSSANSVTSKSVSRDGMVDGRKITVIDTPGFFDTDRKDEEINSEIVKALIDCAPVIDAFVLVLRVGRYTEHENEVFQKVLNVLKEGALKHTVILFTFGEQLEGQTIKEFVKDNLKLLELIDKCGGRCHVIDNKYWNNCPSEDKSNRVQVKNLMETIDKMVKENGCYSSELLQMVEENIQEEMKINKDNLSPEEKREKAKKIVHEKFLKQVAGATTGMLLGALLGAAVALASVAAVLLQCCPLKELIKAKVAAAFVGAGKAVVAGGAAAAVETAVAGGAAAAVETAVAGGAAAAVEAAVAGGAAAAVEAAVAGGAAAAVEAAVAGGAAAAVEAAVAGGAAAAVEAAVAGGAAAAVEAAVAGGAAAAVEAAVAGGAAAAVEAAVAGGAAAAVEAAVAGGAAAAVEAAVAGGAAAAVEAAVAGGAAAAVEAAVAGGAAAAVEAAVAGGAAAAVETAVAGGAAAAVETAVAGGAAAAVETAVAGGAAAAVETAVAGGAAAAAETGAAAGAGVTAGTIAAGVLGAAALAGAVGGGVTGWKAAEDADSVSDAMKKAATANYENAKAAVEKIQELVTLVLTTKHLNTV